MTQYLAELSKPIIILVMQTFERRRVSFNFFFSEMHYCRRLYSEVLEIFQKAGGKRKYHLLAFKSLAGTERNVKKSLALRMTVKTWMLTLVSPRKCYHFLF